MADMNLNLVGFHGLNGEQKRHCHRSSDTLFSKKPGLLVRCVAVTWGRFGGQTTCEAQQCSTRPIENPCLGVRVSFHDGTPKQARNLRDWTQATWSLESIRGANVKFKLSHTNKLPKQGNKGCNIFIHFHFNTDGPRGRETSCQNPAESAILQKKQAVLVAASCQTFPSRLGLKILHHSGTELASN